jgi:8-oxo-dGTP diphosphatase
MREGTSILFVDRCERVLLFLRDDKSDIPYPGCWDILGGHVEDGETPEECIVREMAEEIGRDIRDFKLFRDCEMRGRREYTYWEKADIDIDKTVLTEGQRLRWFTQDEVRNLPEEQVACDFKPVILDFFAEAPFRRAGGL